MALRCVRWVRRLISEFHVGILFGLVLFGALPFAYSLLRVLMRMLAAKVMMGVVSGYRHALEVWRGEVAGGRDGARKRVARQGDSREWDCFLVVGGGWCAWVVETRFQGHLGCERGV